MTKKVGDEVRCTRQCMYDLTENEIYAIRSVCKAQEACDWGFVVLGDVGDKNNIINESYEPATDTPAPPPVWRDMTDAEKGALLLALYEGKVIEYYIKQLDNWCVDPGFDPHQNPGLRYRVAEPAPKEPREWLINMDTLHVQAVPSGFEPDGSASYYVHVREVTKQPETQTKETEQ